MYISLIQFTQKYNTWQKAITRCFSKNATFHKKHSKNVLLSPFPIVLFPFEVKKHATQSTNYCFRTYLHWTRTHFTTHCFALTLSHPSPRKTLNQQFISEPENAFLRFINIISLLKNYFNEKIFFHENVMDTKMSWVDNGYF